MKTLLPKGWPAATDWTEYLRAEISRPEMQETMLFVEQARNHVSVFPPENEVFNAFCHCEFKKTQVVILGQDPYHGVGQAHGLAFSVKKNCPMPPSLKNIFKELKNDLGIENHHGDLTAWAKQGVLLLNTVLTVESSKANSHRNRGWEVFTDAVIKKLGQRNRPATFLLWGKTAAMKRDLISKHHQIIESPHPSPLSAYRGFFGSQPFSKTNRWLLKNGETEIDWTN